ncbi:hypothetical protein BH11PSE13_BH11PSE13_29730 [soil metagenome]
MNVVSAYSNLSRRGLALPLGWRSLLYGIFFGATITAGEALSLPFSHLSGGDHLAAIGLLLPAWILSGIAIAFAAFTAERLRLTRRFAAIFLVLLSALMSAAACALWWLCNALQIPIATVRALGDGLPSWSNFFYMLWMTLFHGSIFTAACMLGMRAERTRRLLGEAQIARGKTEAMLVDAEFDTLKARIDPAFLLRVLGEVQRRYVGNATSADALLDELVAFLRNAMPSVRSPTSTLMAELNLAQRYAHLCQEIDPRRAHWRFEFDGTLPSIAFPPLLLLPLLDHLTPPGASDCSGEVRVAAGPGALLISVRAVVEGCTLPRSLSYRLQVALQATFGDDCSVLINHAARHGTPALALRIQVDPAHQSADCAAARPAAAPIPPLPPLPPLPLRPLKEIHHG